MLKVHRRDASDDNLFRKLVSDIASRPEITMAVHLNLPTPDNAAADNIDCSRSATSISPPTSSAQSELACSATTTSSANPIFCHWRDLCEKHRAELTVSYESRTQKAHPWYRGAWYHNYMLHDAAWKQIRHQVSASSQLNARNANRSGSSSSIGISSSGGAATDSSGNNETGVTDKDRQLTTPDKPFDYYWFVEYDARFVGSWLHLILACNPMSHDVIGTDVEPFQASNWGWEPWRIPGERWDMPLENRWRFFAPVMRQSHRFCAALAQSVEQTHGTYETYVASTCVKHFGTTSIANFPSCFWNKEGVRYSPTHCTGAEFDTIVLDEYGNQLNAADCLAQGAKEKADTLVRRTADSAAATTTDDTNRVPPLLPANNTEKKSDSDSANTNNDIALVNNPAASSSLAAAAATTATTTTTTAATVDAKKEQNGTNEHAVANVVASALCAKFRFQILHPVKVQSVIPAHQLKRQIDEVRTILNLSDSAAITYHRKRHLHLLIELISVAKLRNVDPGPAGSRLVQLLSLDDASLLRICRGNLQNRIDMLSKGGL